MVVPNFFEWVNANQLFDGNVSNYSEMSRYISKKISGDSNGIEPEFGDIIITNPERIIRKLKRFKQKNPGVIFNEPFSLRDTKLTIGTFATKNGQKASAENFLVKFDKKDGSGEKYKTLKKSSSHYRSIIKYFDELELDQSGLPQSTEILLYFTDSEKSRENKEYFDRWLDDQITIARIERQKNSTTPPPETSPPAKRSLWGVDLPDPPEEPKLAPLNPLNRFKPSQRQNQPPVPDLNQLLGQSPEEPTPTEPPPSLDQLMGQERKPGNPKHCFRF